MVKHTFIVKTFKNGAVQDIQYMDMDTYQVTLYKAYKEFDNGEVLLDFVRQTNLEKEYFFGIVTSCIELSNKYPSNYEVNIHTELV